MARDQKEEEGEVQVKDRRRFNPDGTPREGSEASGGQEEKGAEPERKKTGDKSNPPEESHEDHPLPEGEMEIDFSTFLLSLASSVQISLGLIPHPVSRKPEINLVSAKQTIDILGMIEQKTEGNLTPDEDHLIKQILYELRMIYVDLVNKIQKGPKGAP